MASAERGDWFEKQTLGSLPERAARRWGAREALCFKGRRLTFADLAAGVDRAAKGLIALGIRPGDKVALWLLNRPEWIEAAFAVMKIGAVLVPINTRLRTEDVAYIADQSDSTALILAERSGPIDYLAMVRELVPPGVAPAATRLPKLRHIVLFGDEPRPDTVAWSARARRRRRASMTRPSPRGPTPSIPRTSPFSCTPRAPPASPRARCTAIA